MPYILSRFYPVFIAVLLCLSAGCASVPRPDFDEAGGDSLIEAGNASMNNGDFEEAVRYYRRALALDMTDSEAFGNLSVAYYYMGRYEEAVREALQAVVLSPEEINWRLNLGASYSRTGDSEGAVRAYGAAVEIARGLAYQDRSQLRNALIGLGRSCELAGRYDQALDAYNEALVFSPNDTELLTGVGNIHFRKERLDEAETLYHRTLAQDSTHTVARYNIALIYARTGRYDEAIALLANNPALDRRLRSTLEGSSVHSVDRTKTRSIAAYRARLGRMGGRPAPSGRPGRRPPPYEYMMGITYYQQGAEIEAMKSFETALEKDPLLAEAHLYIGNLHAQQNRHDLAADAYEKAIEIDAGFAEAYNNLGSMYANLDRADEAMEAYRNALSLNDLFYDARTNLGLLYAESGRLDEAVDEYMKVIRAEIGIAEVHNNLGIVYLRQGRLEEGRLQFEKAIALREDFAEAYNNLALSHSREAIVDDVIGTWRRITAGWAGHGATDRVNYDWLPLRRVPARSSAVGGGARSAYREGVEAAFSHDLDTALELFESALSARPEWPAALLARSAVLLAQGDWNAAASAAREAMDSESADPLPAAILAIATISAGDYEEALKSWEDAVRRAGDADGTAAREAGIAMRRRIEAANRTLDALEQAIALRPDFSTAHFNIGLVNDQLHRYHQAIENYEEVIRLAPGLAAGHFRLSIAFYRLGVTAKARDSMREYLGLSTDPMLLRQVETFLNKSR